MTVEKPNQYDTHLGGVEMSEDITVSGGRRVKQNRYRGELTNREIRLAAFLSCFSRSR